MNTAAQITRLLRRREQYRSVVLLFQTAVQGLTVALFMLGIYLFAFLFMAV